MRSIVRKSILFSYSLALSFVVHPCSSVADSLWEHESSLVRLVTNGHARRILVESPSRLLKKAGVERGTILFEGAQVGDKYIGKARSFSKNCSVPIVYDVNGNEFRETKIILQGRRAVYDENCRLTGRFIHEHLSFKYVESVQEKKSGLLSEEDARAKAVAILKGEPYGRTQSVVAKRIIEGQLITAGTICGRKVDSPSWKFQVSVPKNSSPNVKNPIHGILVIDARSGMMLCSDLPFLF